MDPEQLATILSSLGSLALIVWITPGITAFQCCINS